MLVTFTTLTFPIWQRWLILSQDLSVRRNMVGDLQGQINTGFKSQTMEARGLQVTPVLCAQRSELNCCGSKYVRIKIPAWHLLLEPGDLA